MDNLSLKRFMQLFRGNPRSFGQWDPKIKDKNRRSFTVKEAYTDFHFSEHLHGVTEQGAPAIGIGIVPIRDDGTCYWGAIDIDNHGKDEDTDILAVEAKVAELSLPLIPCRSKSGGVHLYLFGSEPMRAEHVRKILQRWATDIGVEGVDCIYPKQAQLRQNDQGERALGNWINLPYYEADNTERYAVNNGKRVTLDQFLDLAEGKMVDAAFLGKQIGSDHSHMPPCLTAYMKRGGLPSGMRNDGIYQLAVYARKKDPETARDAAHDLAVQFTADNPLPFKERDKTIRSAMGKSYNYRCSLFTDVCDREACRRLKYGISEAEYENLNSRAAMPSFSNLIKFRNSDPIRFDLDMGVEGHGPVRKLEGLTIEELSNFPLFRTMVMERTHVVLPRLKADEWDKVLADLFATVRIEEIPEDSTPQGALRTKIYEFARKADLESPGDRTADRQALLRGVPVVQVFEGVRVVMFRSVDFLQYLRRTKSDTVKEKDLWFKASKYAGVQSTRVKIGNKPVSVWFLPVEDVEEERMDVPHLAPEF